MGVRVLNPAAPRRRTRAPIQIPIDLTVTPPVGGANAQLGTPVGGMIATGEMVYLTAAFKAASLNTLGTTNANAASFIGVSEDDYPPVYGAGISAGLPPGDLTIPMITIVQDGECLFNTTASDTYHPEDLVYLGADGRTVSKTATGTSIGVVSEDQRQTSPANVGLPTSVAIAGGVGVQIYVRIKPAKAPFG